MNVSNLLKRFFIYYRNLSLHITKNSSKSLLEVSHSIFTMASAFTFQFSSYGFYRIRRRGTLAIARNWFRETETLKQ